MASAKTGESSLVGSSRVYPEAWGAYARHVGVQTQEVGTPQQQNKSKQAAKLTHPD